jgi:Ca2+-transporting ATPase
MSATPISWHALTPDDALRELQSTPAGLRAEEVASRQRLHGPNELAVSEQVSAWALLASQFKNALIVILLIATAISATLGHVIESTAIAVIILFAVALGFVQEYRAERALNVLREMAAPSASVIRGGCAVTVASRELVPGDIIAVTAGDKVPADARLLSASNLQANEASLTGESYPAQKDAEMLATQAAALGDRGNLIYSGTTITYGRGTAVVVATGTRSEFGKISGILATLEEPRTPLQQNLDRLGRLLAVAALLIVAVVVAIGVVRGESTLEMLIFGIALAVAVVPEALPAVVTVSLALGLQRMAKQHALMRHLPAVETLGSTTVICTDKTGTLTKDEMTARELWIDGQIVEVSGSGYAPDGSLSVGGRPLDRPSMVQRFCEAAMLCCDAELIEEQGRWSVRGDPSEGALLSLAAKVGIDRRELESNAPRIDEIPFSSERKRMTTLHRTAGGTVAYSKGAPEVILDACSRIEDRGKIRDLDDDSVRLAHRAVSEMGGRALRVLAVAYKPDASRAGAESDMIFLGLAGLMDPPRDEVARSIEICNEAGIKPVMITGDHPETGAAIARELGILRSGRVVTGAELESMTNSELEREIHRIEVYARVSPEQKIRVVDAWQRRGDVVAMTGDGINDAPALKKADIGIAMGMTGTDVSREAADMTLTDDNFASIVNAMAEGRRIFANIRKFLMFLLSANFGEIGVIAITSMMGLPLPLSAVQILYINLATDGLPALALSADPPEAGLMQQSPEDSSRSVFSRRVVTLMVVGGLWSMIASLTVFWISLRAERDTADAMAMTFLTLVLIELFEVFSFRSERQSIFIAPFANRWLNIVVLAELALLPLIVYVPALQVPFGTFPMSAHDWLLILGLAIAVIPVLELTKFMVRPIAAAR